MTAHTLLYLVAISLIFFGLNTPGSAADDVTIYKTTPSTNDGTTPATKSAMDPNQPKVHRHHHKTTTADKTAVKSSTASGTNAPPGTNSTSGTTASLPKTASVTKTAVLSKTSPLSKTAAPSGKNTASLTKTATTTSSRKRRRKPLASVKTPPSTKPEEPPAISISAPAPVTPPVVDTTPITVTKSAGDSHASITIAPPPLPHTPTGAGPEVETGLPVARRGTITVSPAPVLGEITLPHKTVPESFPPSPGVSTGSYLPSGRAKSALDNFTFTNFDHRIKNVYPWKVNITTTIFWIGEGSTPLSATTNEASAWDQDWRTSNGGTDDPNARDRDGYFDAHHGTMVNPFYVALPFNDLAFPDKARRWLPAGWYRPPRGGKQVSACQNRWVEIKNEQGDVCFAQWEDVGPLRYDHAEYVFGNDSPDTYVGGVLDHAGLDVSPAVAQYLDINERNRFTRWRFIDDADVPPGKWLMYDEQALLFKAMKDNAPGILPLKDNTAPMDDPSDVESNKKRVESGKG
jgi:hypothetical protein